MVVVQTAALLDPCALLVVVNSAVIQQQQSPSTVSVCRNYYIAGFSDMQIDLRQVEYGMRNVPLIVLLSRILQGTTHR